MHTGQGRLSFIRAKCLLNNKEKDRKRRMIDKTSKTSLIQKPKYFFVLCRHRMFRSPAEWIQVE